MPDTHLILHVKGTENETTMLPKQTVRQAISEGQLTHSQLIWSPEENRWKQIRELPNLLPSQKLAPAPAPRVGTVPMPKVVTVPRAASGPVPRIAGQAAGPTPQVAETTASPTPRVAGTAASPTPRAATPRAQAAATPRARAATPRVQAQPAQPRTEKSTGELVVKEDHGSHPVKWLCIILAVVIVVAISLNYFLVGRSLSSRMSETSYSDVTVYGHLGAFMQPNVLVIHVFPNSHVTEANLTDFMVALAKNTPNAPLSQNAFERVALTSGWMGTYSMSGYAWREIGNMDKDDAAQRKEAIIDQLGTASGQSLTAGSSTLSDADLQARREQLWKAFVAQFTRS